jgi:hypothetical protein
MDKERRTRLRLIIDRLDVLCNELRTIREAEYSAFIAKSKALQCSGLGEVLSANVDDLTMAVEDLDAAENKLLFVLKRKWLEYGKK